MQLRADLRADANTAPPTRARPLTVALVEDDWATLAHFVQAITASPGLHLGLAASTGGEMMTWLARHEPDVLLVDLGLPDLSGIHVISACATHYPACSIMVISMFGDEAHVLASIEAGASGYLLKDSLTDEIGACIHELAAGGAPMSPLIARGVMRRFREFSRARGVHSASAREPVGGASTTSTMSTASAASPLTAREQEVLEHVARGFSYAEIGGLTHLSTLTVQTHIKRIYRKLAVHSKSEAVFEAQQMGWIRK